MRKSMLILMLIFSINIQLFSTDFELKNLKETSNQADYLLITSPNYFDNVNPLLIKRSNQNFNVKLVDINKIESQFKSVSRAESIRNFLFYANSNWENPKPKYVLLVGWLDTIPNLIIKLDKYSEFDSLGKDNYLVLDTNSGKSKLIMSIGRIPARNSKDIDRYLDKITLFEDSNIHNYKSDLVSITDSLDNDLFESATNKIIDNYFLKSKTNIISGNSKSKDYGNTSDLVNACYSGTNYLLGMIHGNMCQWGYNNILNCNMFDTLNFGQKPFVFIAVSCSQGFNDPNKRSILEKLIFDTNGGIIASVASETVASFNSGMQLIYSFLDFSKSPNMKIGDVFKEAINLNISNSNLLNYTLLGDPLLKIPVEIAEINYSYKESSTFISPNPASDYIEISLDSPSNKMGSVGVSYEIFNIFGELQELPRPLGTPSKEGEVRVDISNLAPGMYFIRIGDKFEKFVKL